MREIIKIVAYKRGKFWVRNPKKIKFWRTIANRFLGQKYPPVYISSTKKVE